MRWRRLYLLVCLILGSAVVMADVVLWSDDFNSADPLADDYAYVSSATKAAGTGEDSSQAVDNTGTYSSIYKNIDAYQYNEGYAKWNANFSNLASDYIILAVHDDVFNDPTPIGTGELFTLQRFNNGSPDTHALYVYDDTRVTEIDVVQNFWPTSGWHDVRFEWKLSTYVGPGYASDGYIKIYIDASLEWSLTNQDWIGASGGQTYPWRSVGVGNVEYIDDLEIGYLAAGSVSASESPSSSPSSSRSPSSSPSASISPSSSPSSGTGFYDCGTPAVGEDLCDKRNVVAFLQWDVTGAITVQYAAGALDFPSTYYGGFMAPRVLRWGPVTRALSDPDGHWEAARFSVELADTDRTIRNYVDTEPVRGTALRAYLISAEGRATAATPRVLFAGPLVKWRPTGDLKIELHGADQLALVLGGLFGRPERQVPTRLISPSDFPNAPPASIGKAVPIIYGWHSASRDDPTNTRGMCPVFYCGTRVLGDSQAWHEWVVCSHAVKSITGLGLDNAPITTGFGSSWLVPGYTGWSTADSTVYRDFNSHRYTVIYGRGTDADAVAGVDLAGETVTPTKTLFVDVEGIEETGDGTGTLIVDIFKQYVHFLINWALQDYESGDWLDMTTGPLYDTGWCVLNVDSWLDATAIATARIARTLQPGVDALTPNGVPYEGVAYIWPAKNVRDWIADFNVSCDGRLGLNQFCQWTLSLLPDGIDATTAESFSDVADIHNASVTIEVNADSLVTRVTANAYRLPKVLTGDAGPGWSTDWAWGGGKLFAEVPQSQWETWYGITHERLELPFILNIDPRASWYTPGVNLLTAGAEDIAIRWIERRRAPQTHVSFRTGLCGLRADVGDIITVNHFAGVTASGWVDRAVQVERLVIDAQAGTVDISGRDVTDFIAVGSASVSPSGSASPTQSPSHSVSPSASVSISPSSSQSPSTSSSPSSSVSSSRSPSSSTSPSSSSSSSVSPSSSTSPSSSSSASVSPSSSVSASLSPSASASPSTP